jgi:hypothetical protein
MQPSLARGIASPFWVSTLLVGVVSMSVTHDSTRNDAEPTTEAEAAENGELGRNMLGLIGAYGMGAALDVSDLYPTHRASASKPEAVPQTA